MTFEEETTGVEQLEHGNAVLEDVAVWGGDFPHPQGLWGADLKARQIDGLCDVIFSADFQSLDSRVDGCVAGQDDDRHIGITFFDLVEQVETAAIGTLEGSLRSVHLTAHLQTRALLNVDQISLYNRLRGYDSLTAPHDHQHH